MLFRKGLWEIIPLVRLQPSFRGYAKKSKFDALPEEYTDSEKDAHKLVTYVCGSNLYEDGEDIKIKPDSDYPDWLWNIYLGPPIPVHELDPSTKKYWYKLKELREQEDKRLLKLRKHTTLQK